jgi:hypothetical protein
LLTHTRTTTQRHLFLFTACLLICVKADKPGKWTLRVLMRMNDGVSFVVKGGLLFSLTAKNRTFLFGCLEQQECIKWKTAFSTALSLDTAAAPSAKEHDHDVGGVLQGLKGALGAFADEEPVVEARKPAAPTAATPAAAAPKQATKAPAADDDDPFAAIARRPSKSAQPTTTTTAAAPALDLFGTPAAPPAAAPAPASGASALTGDALMKLYAQSAQPQVQTTPHYANDFFATPASGFGAAPTQAGAFGGFSGFGAAPTQAGAFGGFGAPLAPAQPQQQLAVAPTPTATPTVAQQQQQAKHDPFASLL